MAIKTPNFRTQVKSPIDLAFGLLRQRQKEEDGGFLSGLNFRGMAALGSALGGGPSGTGGGAPSGGFLSGDKSFFSPGSDGTFFDEPGVGGF